MSETFQTLKDVQEKLILHPSPSECTRIRTLCDVAKIGVQISAAAGVPFVAIAEPLLDATREQLRKVQAVWGVATSGIDAALKLKPIVEELERHGVKKADLVKQPYIDMLLLIGELAATAAKWANLKPATRLLGFNFRKARPESIVYLNELSDTVEKLDRQILILNSTLMLDQRQSIKDVLHNFKTLTMVLHAWIYATMPMLLFNLVLQFLDVCMTFWLLHCPTRVLDYIPLESLNCQNVANNVEILKPAVDSKIESAKPYADDLTVVFILGALLWTYYVALHSVSKPLNSKNAA